MTLAEKQLFLTYALLIEFLHVWQTVIKSQRATKRPPGRSFPMPDLQGRGPSESYLQSGSGRQVGGDAALPPASVAGSGVEEAVEQPRRVKHVDHEDAEQQLGDGAPFGAAVGGLGVARCQHGGCLKPVIDGNNLRAAAGLVGGSGMRRPDVDTRSTPATASFRLSVCIQGVKPMPACTHAQKVYFVRVLGFALFFSLLHPQILTREYIRVHMFVF